MKIICQSCGLPKPTNDFIPDAESLTRFSPECKKCSGHQDDLSEWKKKYKFRCTRKEQRIFKVYQEGARKRNLEFMLTFDDMRRFRTRVPCYYCGDKLKRIGIDRVDNAKGYSIENCVACCTVCNKMKMAHSMDFFLNHLDKIHRNMMKEILRLRVA